MPKGTDFPCEGKMVPADRTEKHIEPLASLEEKQALFSQCPADSPCLVLWAGTMDGPHAPWRDSQGWSPSSSRGGPKCSLGMVIV